ncbi:MAG: hypothetical protein KA338_22670 [Chloroflexi bacterium]|nr:hypothetical protein [Chloroflexota bacterium]
MNRRNILFWVFVALSIVFGIIITSQGFYLYVNGQDCRSYNDYACAFSAMFSIVVIPYGLAIILLVGLASLPYKITRLPGSIFSILLGAANVGLCCLITLGVASNAGKSLESQEIANFLLLPLSILTGGIALLGVGIIGYLKTKEPSPFRNEN